MYSSFDTQTPLLPSGARRFQIRPLSTGEVLDRALSLYGSNFWFCTGAAALSGMVGLLSGASRVIYLQAMHLPMLTPFFRDLPLALILLFWFIVGVIAYGLSHAALVWGLGSNYLGRPASLHAAAAVVRPHWLRYPGVTLMQLLIAGWPVILAYALFGGVLLGLRSQGPAAVAIGAIITGLLVFASLPYGTYRYLQLALAMPAAVLEGLPVRASLQRSRALLIDRKGRVFVVFLLAGALYLVIGTVTAVLNLMALRGTAQIISQVIALLVTFLANLLLQPLFSAAFTVLYYDERVRREGFDLQLMMSEGQFPAQSPAASAGGNAYPVQSFAQENAYAPVSTPNPTPASTLADPPFPRV